MAIFVLSDSVSLFPDPRLADSDGLLAVGGDLSEERLLAAYRAGIFPWFSGPEPILWWSPDPRLVLFPDRLKVSRSLRRLMNRGTFTFTIDAAFDDVIKSCAGVRIENGEDTWLGDDMIDAYCRLHRAGYAHSVETWHDGALAGGLYGVTIGRCFFGESMFTRVSNASKAALVKLVELLEAHGFEMIDCQVTTAHLQSLGAVEIERELFLSLLEKAVEQPALPGLWDINGGLFFSGRCRSCCG